MAKTDSYIDWTGCELVERIPGKVSGASLLKNTRLPVEAILENYDAFVDIEGLSPDAALAETWIATQKRDLTISRLCFAIAPNINHWRTIEKSFLR